MATDADAAKWEKGTYNEATINRETSLNAGPPSTKTTPRGGWTGGLEDGGVYGSVLAASAAEASTWHGAFPRAAALRTGIRWIECSFTG